jgi:hypothetical protein
LKRPFDPKFVFLLLSSLRRKKNIISLALPCRDYYWFRFVSESYIILTVFEKPLNNLLDMLRFYVEAYKAQI